MTQPVQPAQPMPMQPAQPAVPFQATPEQKAQFFQQVARVAAALTQVAGQEEPHVAAIALVNVLAACTQHTKWPREAVVKFFTDAYDQTRATMQSLGVVPGQPPPADIQDRLRKLIEAHPDRPPQELLKQLLDQVQAPR